MDPRYEFEAPKFVDFTKLGTVDEEDHGVDSFFDVDMETGQAVSGEIAIAPSSSYCFNLL